MEQDAVGELLGWGGAGGQRPDGFGGQGGFANAAGAAEGGDLPRLQVGQQLSQVVLAVGEVGGARGFFHRHPITGDALFKLGQIAPVEMGAVVLRELDEFG